MGGGVGGEVVGDGQSQYKLQYYSVPRHVNALIYIAIGFNHEFSTLSQWRIQNCGHMYTTLVQW